MTVYVLKHGKSNARYHGPKCRCLREHGPYVKLRLTQARLRGHDPCGYCGGK